MNTFTPTNFMLLPTMACQAACKYCFAQKKGIVMSVERSIHITLENSSPDGL